MTFPAKAPPPPGGDGGAHRLMSFPGGNDNHLSQPSPKNQGNFRNPRAVREAKRLLQLEFLHECAGGIQIHAALIQSFASLGDAAGTCYSLKRLFAHAKAAHAVYVELRD